MLLPPDLRDWVPNDHLIHFVIDAIDTCSEQIKHRGTGHRQYPPPWHISEKECGAHAAGLHPDFGNGHPLRSLESRAGHRSHRRNQDLANASKHSALSYGHPEHKLQELDLEIQELLAKAEEADSTPLQEGLTIPDEIQRRQERQVALRRAKAEMEARAYARCQAEAAQYKAKMAHRQSSRGKATRTRSQASKRHARSQRNTPKSHHIQKRMAVGVSFK
jgi:hypothetical protein